MTDRPILFNGPLVRAILDGRKTQTRRLLKPQPPVGDDGRPLVYFPEWGGIHAEKGHYQELDYAKGDRLWARETWSDVNYYGAPAVVYKEDGDKLDLMSDPSFLTPDGCFNYDDPRLIFGKARQCLPFCNWENDLLSGVEGEWRPSIHMPRWASRLTLIVTDVRVQRVQNISEADAISEGIEETKHPNMRGNRTWRDYTAGRGIFLSPRDSFRTLWSTTYGHDAWQANPWVTAITFEIRRCNIDQMEENT